MPFTEKPCKMVEFGTSEKGFPFIRLQFNDVEEQIWVWIDNDWQEVKSK